MVDYSTVELTSSQIMRAGGGSRLPTIFLAYRMKDPASIAFKKSFEKVLAGHPTLGNFTVTTGHVEIGEYWATQIRKRINAASVVVADLTGPSREVLFEVGFAFGLRKAILPVVSTAAHRADVPRWLTPIQSGTYESTQDVSKLIRSIAHHVASDDVLRPKRPPEPIPGLAVWLPSRDWGLLQQEQFEARAAVDLTTLVLDVPRDAVDLHSNILDTASSANFLYALLEGTRSDHLVHFVCGAIVARPKAGISSSKIERRVALIVMPGQKADDLVADSASKCDEVHVMTTGQVLREIKKSSELFQRWARLE